MLSSQAGDFLEKVRSHIGEEVRITGFSEENITIFASQYLGSEELCKEFLLQTEKAGIHKLLHIPIILLMVCTVFLENSKLSYTGTGLFKHVV